MKTVIKSCLSLDRWDPSHICGVLKCMQPLMVM